MMSVLLEKMARKAYEDSQLTLRSMACSDVCDTDALVSKLCSDLSEMYLRRRWRRDSSGHNPGPFSRGGRCIPNQGVTPQRPRGRNEGSRPPREGHPHQGIRHRLPGEDAGGDWHRVQSNSRESTSDQGEGHTQDGTPERPR